MEYKLNFIRTNTDMIKDKKIISRPNGAICAESTSI
ncbi:hypothetical protein SAMN05444274_102169 [Mariniphaga anaerophila]|uniref:Uncharacterized protein n=1 Tax=Mariniphaga anaerophila TaxID=1484053 RepID=A0A1M4VQD9_9BACT|nr:hypothetical protein SAMN05444274_102169 [Mariniphaga anaerophila]